jgi:hypothetical protein
VNNHYVLQEAIRHMTLNCWLQILEKNKCPEQFGPKIEAISFIVINIKIYKIVYQLHMNFGFKIYSYVVLSSILNLIYSLTHQLYVPNSTTKLGI